MINRRLSFCLSFILVCFFVSFIANILYSNAHIKVPPCAEPTTPFQRREGMSVNNDNSTATRSKNEGKGNEKVIPSVFPRTISPHERNQTKSQVFILTLPRSGSSFLGELFKRNPDFVYLFEVTRVLLPEWHPANCNDSLSHSDATLVHNLFNCDFSLLKSRMDDVPWDPRYSWSRAMEQSTSERANLCFPNTTDTPDIIAARAQQSIAVKEIFMWGPKLDWLYKSVGPELKVIWLVRDIRGWVSSFMQPEPSTNSNTMYSGWYFDTRDFWLMYKFCKGLNRIEEHKLHKIEALLSNTSAPIHQRLAAYWTVDVTVAKYYLEKYSGQFLLVQYEHLSLHPFDVSQQIYEFLGYSITHQDVLRWLSAATTKGNVHDRYSTSRESEKMALIWMQRLSYSQLLEIEEIAGKMIFDFFKYPYVSDLLQLNSTTTIIPNANN